MVKLKLFREALIILGIYLVGEFLSTSLHLPIPGNILGMIILFILLCTIRYFYYMNYKLS